MRDPHQNLFFYYRGASKKGITIGFDPQIENNTTKSLINVLEFLHGNNFDYLQNEIFEHPNLNLKKEETSFYKLQEWKADSIPDVRIKLKTYNIYIEIKVNAQLKGKQLANHLKALDPSDHLIVLTNCPKDEQKVKKFRNKRIHYLSWSDIHLICRKIVGQFSGKEKYYVKLKFLNQFIEYLEMVVMTEFTGFRDDDFDYFLDENKDYGPILKGRLDTFAKKIKEMLPPKFKKYSEIKVGNIKKYQDPGDRGAWVAIKKPEDKKDILRHCNFSIEISPSELSVNVVIRDGRIFDKKNRIKKKTPLGIFYQILEEKKEILNILKNIKPGISFVIYSRTAKDGKSRPRPGNEKWTKYFSMDIKYIKSGEDIRMLQYILSKVDYPGIHIRKTISRIDKETLSNPNGLVKKVIDTLMGLSPILEVMEGRVSRTV